MPILGAQEIRRRLADRQTADPFFLAPILEPAEQLRDNQACVDIRLGTEFRIAVPARGDSVDTLTADDAWSDPENLQERVYVPLGGYIVVHPHQLVLGQSLEYMRFPRNLAGTVLSRSSWGRRGLVVATAIGIHPRFSGVLTLELRNLGEMPLRLYPGDAIAQLFLHTVTESSEDSDSDTGQYAGSTVPRLGRLRYSKTEEKLRELVKRYKVRTGRVPEESS